jgi:cell division protein FtsI/penicillin-binding protein 2
VSLAGKTGTAQAQRLKLARVGRDGKVLLDESGRPLYEIPSISTREDRNEQMPWYRGSGLNQEDLSHAWFIGFAPARNPKIAFAVMLEYGGSGGHDTAPIVRAMLDACIEHGYLPAEH